MVNNDTALNMAQEVSFTAWKSCGLKYYYQIYSNFVWSLSRISKSGYAKLIFGKKIHENVRNWIGGTCPWRPPHGSASVYTVVLILVLFNVDCHIHSCLVMAVNRLTEWLNSNLWPFKLILSVLCVLTPDRGRLIAKGFLFTI